MIEGFWPNYFDSLNLLFKSYLSVLQDFNKKQ